MRDKTCLSQAVKKNHEYLIPKQFVSFLAKVLKDDITKHRALFQTAENAGQKLIERSQEDPAVVADVYSKLYKVRTALDKLSARADQRLGRLQHVLLQSQEFHVSFAEFLEKLGRVEEQIALQAPVSGVYGTVKEQNQQQKVSSETLFVFCSHGSFLSSPLSLDALYLNRQIANKFSALETFIPAYLYLILQWNPNFSNLKGNWKLKLENRA